jgi:Ca2+-binding RTX toxin-like protein
VFVLDAAPITNQFDTIEDYTAGQDTIQLVGDAFNLFDYIGGTLDSTVFALGDHATTAEHRVLYDAGTGMLYFDEDGAGGQDALLIAVFSNTPTLTASSFFIV